jgi:hypothetical protein
MIRTVIVGLFCVGTAALAEPVTINGTTGNIEYRKPDHRGVAVDHVTIDGKTYTTCKRTTPTGWIEVDCKAGREMEGR